MVSFMDHINTIYSQATSVSFNMILHACPLTGSKVWLPRSSQYLQVLTGSRQRRRGWAPLSPVSIKNAMEINSDSSIIEIDSNPTNLLSDMLGDDEPASLKYKSFAPKSIYFTDVDASPWKPPRVFLDLVQSNATTSLLEDSLRQVNRQIDREKKLQAFIFDRAQLASSFAHCRLGMPAFLLPDGNILSEADEKALKSSSNGRGNVSIDKKITAHVASRR